ncbi:hypothetical protein GDO86_008600 [Hymenochirus boettgeri]|uniref:Uncharacterized protein n=1 Tax=Hymenochirus boettgeri TaxID=247094 RepID=A0A8T2J2D0_9PIPI|nr:hypothetical protein GDO86_008600 [Hymenochirus boettgeri]KAG8437974.1 hypothetical protein GDO86_008600 [Hymenochirus boettgeri]
MAVHSSAAVFKIEEYDDEDQGGPVSDVDPPHAAGIEGPTSKSFPYIRSIKGKERRIRTESASDSTETDKEDELHRFRTRSRSAPSSMLVAAKYGRELRRMSDEFDQSFIGLPRPKSANAAGELAGSKSFKELFMDLFIWRRSKEKNEEQ